MSDTPTSPREPDPGLCNYPGCTRPSRPDPAAAGRPALYCEQADDNGGPVHNRAAAWRARRAQQGAVATRDGDTASAPVSMARATLEQQVAELPDRVAALRQYLDDVVTSIRTAGDVEAAGAEVEDAHRDALTKITDAERRTAAAERAARLADDRTVVAQRERDEADAAAEDALAETGRVREEAQAEIAAARAQVDAALTQAQVQLAAAAAEHQQQMAQRDTELRQALEEANAARLAAASAHAAQQSAEENATRERETTAALRRELDQTRREADQTRLQLESEIETARQATQDAAAQTAALRIELATTRAESTAAQRVAETSREELGALRIELQRQREDARAERDADRTAHAEQLAQARRDADERVHALTEALTLARETAATYRAQLATSSTPTEKPSRKRTPRSPAE